MEPTSKEPTSYVSGSKSKPALSKEIEKKTQSESVKKNFEELERVLKEKSDKLNTLTPKEITIIKECFKNDSNKVKQMMEKGLFDKITSLLNNAEVRNDWEDLLLSGTQSPPLEVQSSFEKDQKLLDEKLNRPLETLTTNEINEIYKALSRSIMDPEPKKTISSFLGKTFSALVASPYKSTKTEEMTLVTKLYYFINKRNFTIVDPSTQKRYAIPNLDKINDSSIYKLVREAVAESLTKKAVIFVQKEKKEEFKNLLKACAATSFDLFFAKEYPELSKKEELPSWFTEV